ncbi:Cell envelope biogenesis protein OmpA [Lysobacter dokdonensis DS-58]|uniref:Cell envelope biogenesis protein OmpA n=1 Tax=Lysobacter dokdonensis DS-58 TaxID=1300345 RepID=A0A0A2WNG7_9GAMM|nr:Cell envelope biogenesis protein OmpA [Lysobacter dokdonensis DS-58]
MKISMIAGVVATGLALAASGCATYTGQTNAPDDPNRTQRGALIGAAIGVAAGLLTGDDAVERRQHALVGAGVGALAGGAVGAYQDKQEAELRRNMAGTGVDVVRQGDNITLNMPSGITFDFNSSTLKPEFGGVLDKVSQTLTQYNQTVVEIAGHTDSVGTDQYNQALSERRANTVAGYLGSHGVLQQRMIVVGAGETRPIASNDTDSGRAQNRRVEITLVPVEQQSGG